MSTEETVTTKGAWKPIAVVATLSLGAGLFVFFWRETPTAVSSPRPSADVPERADIAPIPPNRKDLEERIRRLEERSLRELDVNQQRVALDELDDRRKKFKRDDTDVDEAMKTLVAWEKSWFTPKTK